MKAEKEFISYLTTEYRSAKTGLPYSQKVASDILSRCKRIELILETELTVALISKEKNFLALRQKIRSQADCFGSASRPYGYLNYFHALTAYYRFAGGNPRKKYPNQTLKKD